MLLSQDVLGSADGSAMDEATQTRCWLHLLTARCSSWNAKGVLFWKSLVRCNAVKWVGYHSNSVGYFAGHVFRRATLFDGHGLICMDSLIWLYISLLWDVAHTCMQSMWTMCGARMLLGRFWGGDMARVTLPPTIMASLQTGTHRPTGPFIRA